uniref:AD domain-containing protein n=1 Tax=Glycine max TaxID=3847 RepID=K7MRV3_SOYBN
MEGGNNSSSNNNPEELAVGCLLSIRTTLGDEFEGQVVTFDRPSNILVLQEPSKPSPRRNLRLLKANYIKDFTFLGHAQDPLDPNTCFLDLTALQQREDVAVRLPVRWDKTVIVVMNEVRVSSPYHSESVVGGTPAANDRVKKVLDFERKRLQLRSSGGQ